MRITSLNMNGIRAAARKGFFEWLPEHDADVICLQETRVQDHQMTKVMKDPPGMHAIYHHAEKPGYSGVAIYSKVEPDNVQIGLGWDELDCEGRFLQADFGRTSVVSLYLPSGSSKDERQAFKYKVMDRFAEWMDEKRKSRRNIVICGDWNIAHTKMDIKNWRGNQKNSGFLPEEREWMSKVFGPMGWRDVFRDLYPDAEGDGYTWWSNRGQAWANNTGWRIDYQVATPGLAKKAVQGSVWRETRFSDHAPLIVDYDA
ncbi:MAG: exodeoxyribonuclease III [Planctomycetes bacterium]|nr:exodeoxyribonuclease III [Planctomycetota bacterium]MCP4770899.1 exodeoxyribonuclease III [Planctomycetota bacterium]MCP4862276.1 exodeoxyribonuclease III [Planctomycetota bacterium]